MDTNMDTHMDDGDGFSTNSEAFLDWLQRSGTTISPKIQLADLRCQHAGRGVIAREDIAEDEELFTIPRSSILTVEASDLPTEIKQQFDDQWLSLITAMIYEYQRGTESTWKPYFDVLPTSFNTLMFWSEDELKDLQGSAVVGKIGKVSGNEAFTAKVLPVLRRHANIFHTTNTIDEELLSLCHRMGSTIMAYAFDLEKSAGPSTAPRNEEDGWEEDEEEEETELLPKGMVPLADMLNADADRNNAKLYYEDDKVVMKSVTLIKAGTEILNDYGPLPTADVLRRYGYTTDNYAQYDVVELALDLIKQVVTTQQLSKLSESDLTSRTTYLDDQGMIDTGYDLSHTSSDPESQQIPEQLCILLNTLTLSKADFDKLKQKDKLPKATLTPESARLLYSILLNRRADYTFDETLNDGGLASLQLDTSSRAGQRHRQARLVVEGEKKVLQEVAETLRKTLSSGGASDINNRKRKAATQTFDEEAQALLRQKRSGGEQTYKKTRR